MTLKATLGFESLTAGNAVVGPPPKGLAACLYGGGSIRAHQSRKRQDSGLILALPNGAIVMKIRTFLLAGAAVLAAGVSAQAADLGAEPADYVKVCDAFGKGFYYAPGTDTCIKIGGYVRFEVRLDPSATNGQYHRFATEAAVNVTASSMTEYGPLVGYVNMVTSGIAPADGAAGTPGAGPSPGVNGLASTYVDDAWLSLGPLLAGYTWSIFQTYEAPIFFNSDIRSFSGRDRLLQARLSWKVGDVGIAVAAEDYSARLAGNIANIPDITAALDAKFGTVGLHVGAGYGSRPGLGSGNTWGANGVLSIGLDQFAKGDVIAIGATYSAGGTDWLRAYGGGSGDAVDGLNYYSIYGHILHYWTSQFSTALAAAYQNNTPAGAGAQKEIVLNGTFRPVTNFAIGADLAATQSGANPYVLKGRIRLQRNFP